MLKYNAVGKKEKNLKQDLTNTINLTLNTLTI